MSAGLHVEQLRMRFGGETADLFAIEQLALAPGASLGIRGPSGAGKTTLFNCLAGIEAPRSGRIEWDGCDIAALAEAARDRWRRHAVGLVFQDFHLVDGLDALGNVLLPAYFGRWRPSADERERAAALLQRVGIDAPRREVALLSRGERQRVAIARALLQRPAALLADEPTASLDPEHRAGVATLLAEAARETGAALLVFSHDLELLARLDRCLELRDGALHETR
ncbi:ABC transporter ATP-binding protein [Rubrivivax gelatinosus]|uniref:ATP-binding cassette domain-containing protein n=1 Tax=Rubrivivax gelatinosus TaxID=28068 RepID=UPI00190509A0|nr:ABC transporter ATP-binding protein [Rubrivivax gelatinosus]